MINFSKQELNINKQRLNINKKVNTTTRKNKRDFMEDRARETESAASNQKMGHIYQVTKQLRG
jgi:hypothetical protein